MRHCPKCGKELFDDELCNCECEVIDSRPNTIQEEKGKWKVIVTAILYPAIAMGISAAVRISDIGLIISVLMNIIGAICIYLGGFTLIVVPLPFIYIYRVGCINKQMKLWKRIILGIVAFGLIFGSIVVASIV